MNLSWSDLLSSIRVMLEDEDDANYQWSDGALLEFANRAVTDFSTHYPKRVRTTITSEEIEDRTIELPEDCVQVLVLEYQYRYLEPVEPTPGFNVPGTTGGSYTYSLEATGIVLNWDPDEDIILHYGASYGVFVAEPAEEPVGMAEEENEITGLPSWAKTALIYYICFQAELKKSTTIANLRTWDTKQDSGKPEDNSVAKQAEYFYTLYKRELDRFKPMSITGWYPGRT
jgi:hypothetical protein